MPYTLEVCVDSTASALAAMQGGAHRLELCADLVIGGTTPSLALLQQVKAETGLPVRALLRPRFGDFCYDRWELAQMAQSAARLVEAGADGIVTGVLTPEGAVDVEAELARLRHDIEYYEGFLASVMKKLSNERFTSKAPAAVVEGERRKQADAEQKLASLRASLASLSK